MPKIIDDSGRIFGKVNIIDFLVIIFILSLMPCFYFGWKLYHSPVPEPGLQPKTTIEIKISEYEQLKNKVRDYELLLDNLTSQRDMAVKERDILQIRIDNFLKKHKREIKYFK